jgi:hypothetical protein
MSAVSPLDRLTSTEHAIARRMAEDAAIAVLELAVQRERARRWSVMPVASLADEARKLNAVVILTPDASMPNGVRVELRPQYVPEWLREAS